MATKKKAKKPKMRKGSTKVVNTGHGRQKLKKLKSGKVVFAGKAGKKRRKK